jgi:hypothetical protein
MDDDSRALLLLLAAAVYLLCQCSVNLSTFHDACREETAVASTLNGINAVLSVGVVCYVAYRLATRC